jgi:uncharacterized oxidoreductase
MESVELDVADPASIAAVAKELIARYPKLNVLVNNAGITHIDDVSGPIEDAVAVATVTTNLLGPIRLTAALVDHLKKQESATVINVSSVLGFVPLTLAAIYSSLTMDKNWRARSRWSLEGRVASVLRWWRSSPVRRRPSSPART